MTTMVITTKITRKYLMNKSKYELCDIVFDLLDKNEGYEFETARLRAALEKVEFIDIDSENGYYACAWCGADEIHKPDCPRQIALGLRVEP